MISPQYLPQVRWPVVSEEQLVRVFCGVVLAVACAATASGQAAKPVASQQIEAGKKSYAASCAGCHGPEGKGGTAPVLAGTSLSDAELANTIANGKPLTAMPAFGSVKSKQDIADIVAYILSLSPGGSETAGAKPTPATPSSATPGATIYAKNCASCHESGGPPFLNSAILRDSAPEYIVHMLAHDVMHAQGKLLTPAQRTAVAEFITGKMPESPAIAAAGRCATPASRDFSGPQWASWGNDFENTRFQPAAAASLAANQVPHLKLKWAFGYPGDFSSWGQPVVSGGRVFVGSALGSVYSLDAATGCTYWRYQAASGVRTAIALGPGHVAYFGDLRANVYAVNGTTGRLLWKVRVSDHPYARVTGAPRLYKGRLYVPVASREEWLASDPLYECCTFRGFLVALDGATGKQLWKTYTIADPARPTHKAENGVQRWGPSGAGLWSSPTLDERRQLLYIGAGNNYSDPQTSNSDAILAFDLKTGQIVWSQQITSGDTYNINCFRDKSNCPERTGPDSDFGASPILYTLPTGKQVLVVSQKSGIVFGLDPENKGAILWQTGIGHGGPLGGIEWGPAASDGVAYVALSDLGFAAGPEGQIPDPKSGGGLFAIDIATGKVIWSVLPAPDACGSIPRCSPAQMAAVTAIPGIVFSGAYDGHLRAYAMADGKILWDFDTAREYKAVNAIAAKGGSIDGPGAVVVNGMLFVNSGYARFGGMPGNVLLAFAPEK